MIFLKEIDLFFCLVRGCIVNAERLIKKEKS